MGRYVTGRIRYRWDMRNDRRDCNRPDGANGVVDVRASRLSARNDRGFRPIFILQRVSAPAISASSAQGATIAPPARQDRHPGDLDTAPIAKEGMLHGLNSARADLSTRAYSGAP